VELLKHFIESLSRRRVLRVARRQFTRPPFRIPPAMDFAIYDHFPDNCHVYMSWPEDKPCWFVRCPWGDGLDGTMLRSSRLMVISKHGGRVLYDGSAHDE
jgi:hypothetical protein